MRQIYKNLYDTLRNTAERLPEKIGVIDDFRQVTYRELLAETDRLAGVLRATYHLETGDRVGLMFVNSVSFLSGFYAICKLGCVAVPVNTKLQPPQISSLLEETGCRVLLAGEMWRDKLNTPTPFPILWATEQGYLLPDSAGICPQPSVQSSSLPAVILYTSGSSGKPKGALLSHENILQTAYGYTEVLGLTEASVTVLSVPIFHILGLSCVSTLFVYLGGTLVLEGYFRPETTLEKMTRYQATHFHSAPTVFSMLCAAKTEAHDLGTLRTAVCGGAFLADEDRDAFCRIAPHASFRLAYGMTETAGAGVLSKGHQQPGSVMPNVQLTVVDDAFQKLPPGQMGQILLAGPSVIAGYTGLSPGIGFHGGWLCTGDLGVLHEDGTIEIHGRSKEMINRGGEKVFPYVVEAALRSFPGVVQAAAVGLPDPVYGEVPAAAIEVQAPSMFDRQALSNYLGTQLAKYECPVAIVCLESLPYTASGKIDKQAVRRLLAEQTK